MITYNTIAHATLGDVLWSQEQSRYFRLRAFTQLAQAHSEISLDDLQCLYEAESLSSGSEYEPDPMELDDEITAITDDVDRAIQETTVYKAKTH